MDHPAERDEIVVIGESLIDIVQTPSTEDIEVVGGSPANVALGLGRLGHNPRLVTALGRDPRGQRVADHLHRSGVVIDPASWSLDRTGTAMARILSDGAAEYMFDIRWELPESLDIGSPRLVHTGSIAAFIEPGSSQVLTLIDRLDEDVLLSFDPNIRPELIGSRADAVERVLRIGARANVVKLSDEDGEWLWPSSSPEQMAGRFLAVGTDLVSITLGGAGAMIFTADAHASLAAPPVSVVDTVGAGDTFMAALIHRVVEEPLIVSRGTAKLRDAVQFAMSAAAVTVQRRGANLPRADEIEGGA